MRCKLQETDERHCRLQMSCPALVVCPKGLLHHRVNEWQQHGPEAAAHSQRHAGAQQGLLQDAGKGLQRYGGLQQDSHQDCHADGGFVCTSTSSVLSKHYLVDFRAAQYTFNPDSVAWWGRHTCTCIVSVSDTTSQHWTSPQVVNQSSVRSATGARDSNLLLQEWPELGV